MLKIVKSVISRLEKEAKKAPSPQPEPDSTTRMESETSEEESSMPFNPMQVLMMQQMMMQMAQPINRKIKLKKYLLN